MTKESGGNKNYTGDGFDQNGFDKKGNHYVGFWTGEIQCIDFYPENEEYNPISHCRRFLLSIRHDENRLDCNLDHYDDKFIEDDDIDMNEFFKFFNT